MTMPRIRGALPRLKAKIVDDGGGGGGGGASAAFSGALMRQLVVGGVLEPAAVADFGIGPSGVTTRYDTDSYWDAGNRRFVIPEDGYYRVFMSSTASFTGGALGDVADGCVIYFDTVDGQPNWEPDFFNVNKVRGSHYVECHFLAGDTIQLTFQNSGSLDMVWDEAYFGITRSGTDGGSWRGIIQDATAFASAVPPSTDTDGDLDNGVSWDTDLFNAGNGTWVIPVSMAGLYRFTATETFLFQGACSDYADFALKLWVNAAVWGVDNKGQLWSNNNNVTFHIFALTAILAEGDVIKVSFEHTNCADAQGPGAGVEAAPYYALEYLGPEPT